MSFWRDPHDSGHIDDIDVDLQTNVNHCALMVCDHAHSSGDQLCACAQETEVEKSEHDASMRRAVLW